ncbi:MAG TPA: ABC transporter permease [Candidatus Dormibacteraeota bacterium]
MTSTLRRVREPGIATAGLVVAFLLAYFIPSSTGFGGGTPTAILFRALVDGLVGSLAAVGIVLMYRSLRIVNFAQVALPAVGAILAFDLIQLIPGFPTLVGIFAGLLLAAVMGGAMYLIFGVRFARAPRIVLTIATVFAGTFLSGGAKGLVDLLPFLPPVNLRPLAQNSGGILMAPYLPFSGFHFTVGSFRLVFGFPELLGIGASIAAIAGLVAFLAFTRFGKALRAMAENSERAALLGISVGMLSLSAWVLSALLGGLADILAGTIHAPARVFGPVPDDLLIPLVAATLARWRSFYSAVCATIGITVVQQALSFQQPGQASLFEGGLFVLVTGGLLLSSRGLGRTAQEATSWQGTQEIRAIPREMAGLPAIRAVRIGALVLLLGVLAALPFFRSVSDIETVTSMALTAMVVVSLMVLTGWAGQASFGQFAFAAVGSLAAGYLAGHVGLTFWLALPLAALVSAVVAVLVGFPALRTPGIFLVVATYAMAVAAHTALFDPKYFAWLDPGVVKRPTLFLINLEDETWMYALAIVALILTILAVRNLRRTRFGRSVIAARENEADLQSAGFGTLRTKLAAFGLAGAIAGLAGGLLAIQQHGSNQTVFDSTQSTLVFEMLILGGASSISGALLGTAVFYGLVQLGDAVPGTAVFLAGLPLIILWLAPGGLASILMSARDAALRIIAQRNRMIVPALYGDVDPEALRLRLIPLAQGTGNAIADAFRLAESRLRWIGIRPEGGVSREREAALFTAAAAGEPAAEGVAE